MITTFRWYRKEGGGVVHRFTPHDQMIHDGWEFLGGGTEYKTTNDDAGYDIVVCEDQTPEPGEIVIHI